MCRYRIHIVDHIVKTTKVKSDGVIHTQLYKNEIHAMETCLDSTKRYWGLRLCLQDRLLADCEGFYKTIAYNIYYVERDGDLNEAE